LALFIARRGHVLNRKIVLHVKAGFMRCSENRPGLDLLTIALTKPKAYEVAAGYLRKVHRVLKKLGREKEW
jgi:hypothetical protein